MKAKVALEPRWFPIKLRLRDEDEVDFYFVVVLDEDVGDWVGVSVLQETRNASFQEAIEVAEVNALKKRSRLHWELEAFGLFSGDRFIDPLIVNRVEERWMIEVDEEVLKQPRGSFQKLASALERAGQLALDHGLVKVLPPEPDMMKFPGKVRRTSGQESAAKSFEDILPDLLKRLRQR